MARKIIWGVIGSGGIAQRRTIPEGIVPAVNAELAAVYDTNPAVNEEVARRYHVKAVGSVPELLQCDLQAVYIASPPSVHCAQTLACAQAGKHVLCEKPLGMTVADAQAMLQTCNESGVQLGAAFMMRFHAQHQQALQLVRAGKIGQPVFARAQLSCWYPPIPGAWRQDPATGGGGSLMDMGGHCIDLLEMFFGPVRAVGCFTNRTLHGYPSEDSAVASLFFANGALGVVDTFFCILDQSSQNRLELYGSQGCILATGTIGQGERGEMVAYLQETVAGYDARQERAGVQSRPIDPAPINLYRAEIEEFSQALLTGREPANNAQLGLQSQRVLAACYEAAKTGRVVGV
jgi:predicted dehydrogenase